MGIAAVPAPLGAGAEDAAPDSSTPTTTTPATDPATPTTTTPATTTPSPPPAQPPTVPAPAPSVASPAAPPPPQAPSFYKPPVGDPLDFAREPLPRFQVPEERQAPLVAPPPRETTPGRLTDGADAGDEAGEDQADEAAEGGTLGSALGPTGSAAQIPNFFIGRFAIPPFLLSIYQAAGIQYGVPWEILAAINEIETDYGRNLNVSTAGATGWMQFMPASWRAYGVDANEDGRKDPYNPVDAIFAAARYLKAAGAEEDLRKAIFAYNHAGWYVDSVLQRARFIAGLPSDLVGSLTGLTQGRSPIAARITYTHRAPGAPARRDLRIDAPSGAPVVAVQDGRIMRIGRSPQLGRFVILRDAYGNTYTYAHLGHLARNVLVAKEQPPPRPTAVRTPLAAPAADPAPDAPASAGSNRSAADAAAGGAAQAGAAGAAAADAPAGAPAPPAVAAKERLFANPGRSRALESGGRRQILDASFALPAAANLRSYFAGDVGLERDELELRRMFAGRRVIAGTILGRVGSTSTGSAPHVRFSIRPPGKGVPQIDPEPFIEGWRLLESTSIFRARGAAALTGGSIGQILLMSKDTLAKRVLANPGIEIYACGRRDIEAGIVDRRVLATLEFLAANGLKPTVSSMRCGHRFFTETGNVSQHSSGNGVDISKINGQSLIGNQGPGSIADITVRRLLTLQGTMAPAQIISLMSYPGAPTAFGMSDHADHIHIGFRPLGNTTGAGIHALGLAPKQWLKLVDRLGKIANPVVSRLRRP
ncbi:MAG: lytic murein transglycosylase [Solirubrobacteraceae bacterium]|nr:lytic murein transglycosylase [Solirubrobacteraceae bacterium]